MIRHAPSPVVPLPMIRCVDCDGSVECVRPGVEDQIVCGILIRRDTALIGWCALCAQARPRLVPFNHRP